MKIYNSKTRQKETFVPLKPGKVGIYACGPTVYNYIHIGNARPIVVFDTLRRYLEYKGNEVTYIQNFTDIDDKMIQRANEEKTTVKDIAERYIKAYFEDVEGLNVRRATVHPKATEHIDEIIQMVNALIEKGKAYVSGTDVYFDTKAHDDYGCLCGQQLEELEEGARIDVDEDKRHPRDFVLWKGQKPGEPAWDSPWGLGRPGWHIECSAMSMKYLGHTIDIHGGGKDLLFPHHENENAQSEAATGETFVRYWMHNGYINVDNRKMSKSAGNFFTLRDIGGEFPMEVVRFFLISAQYRSPINFSREQLEQAQAALERMYTARDNLHFLLEHSQEKEGVFASTVKGFIERFEEAMDDDLNTADAIGVIFELVREANTQLNAQSAKADIQAALDGLLSMTDILGILQKNENAIPDEVEEMAEARQAARAAKNWAEADRLRNAIQAAGYVVEDTPQGPKVRPIG